MFKTLDTESIDTELEMLLKDTEKKAEFGPKLLPYIAVGFQNTVTRPLTKSSAETLKEKIKIPDNCKEFMAPKVNPEIWRNLPTHARLNDVRQQQNQQTLSVALTTLANMSNEIASRKAEIPSDLRNIVLKYAIDGANLLGDQFQSITTSRKLEIRKFISHEYGQICTAPIPNSEWLFGSDLAENLKAAKTSSTIMKASSYRGQRFKPYQHRRPESAAATSSLNSYRPFLHQRSRGNGQFRPRATNRFPHPYKTQFGGVPNRFQTNH